MPKRFQYIMIGSGLTLLVILGTMTLIFSQARASDLDKVGISLTSETHSPVVEQTETVSSPHENRADFSEVVDAGSFPLPGTIDEPETDPSTIVFIVKEMARQQENALLGESGWLHTITQPYNLEGQTRGLGPRSATTSEIVPREEIVPDSALFESWYKIDEKGIYNEAISLVTSADGVVHQKSVLVENQWVNLTLQANDFAQEQYKTTNPANEVILPIASVAEMLDAIQTRENIKMQAYLSDEQYVIIVEELYTEPVEDSVQQIIVMGGKFTYFVDAKTSQLLSTEMHLLSERGNWLLREKWDYHSSEFVTELPEDVAQLYTNSMEIVFEEEN